MNPICILDGAMNGTVLYKNPEYKTRTKVNIFIKLKVLNFN